MERSKCYQYITITDYDLLRWKGLEGEQLIERKKNSFPAWINEEATPVYSFEAYRHLSIENRKLYNEELHDLPPLIEYAPRNSVIYIENANDIANHLETTARVLQKAFDKGIEIRFDRDIHVNDCSTIRFVADLAKGFEQYFGIALEERDKGISQPMIDKSVNGLLLKLEKLPSYKEIANKLREEALMNEKPVENSATLLTVYHLIEEGIIKLENADKIKGQIGALLLSVKGTKPLENETAKARGRKEDPKRKEEIRRRFMKGEKQVDIARELNVSTSMVSRAVKDLKK